MLATGVVVELHDMSLRSKLHLKHLTSDSTFVHRDTLNLFRVALVPWCTRRMPPLCAWLPSTRRTRVSWTTSSPTSGHSSTRASRGSGVVVSWVSRLSASLRRGSRQLRPSLPRKPSTKYNRQMIFLWYLSRRMMLISTLFGQGCSLRGNAWHVL